MNVFDTVVERRKAFLGEFYPERLKEIKSMAMKAVDNSLAMFEVVCCEANYLLNKLDQEVFYAWLWQYVSIYY